MTVHRYDPINVWGTKNVKCAGCNKRLKRQKTFSQTMSPFNKNADGQLKTHREIFAELQADRVAWEKASENCPPCAAKAREVEAARRVQCLWAVAWLDSTSPWVQQRLAEGFIPANYAEVWADDELSARAAYDQAQKTIRPVAVLLRRAAPGAGWDVEAHRTGDRDGLLAIEAERTGVL
jgi:hypothetical protein